MNNIEDDELSHHFADKAKVNNPEPEAPDTTNSDFEEDDAYREMLRELLDKVAKGDVDDVTVTEEMQQHWRALQVRLREEGLIPMSSPFFPAPAPQEIPAIERKPLRETKPVFPHWTGWVAAACISLVMGLGLHLREQSLKQGYTELVAEADTYEMISTRDTARRVKISDGSYIHLNRHTTIAFNPKTFNKDSREIWIREGEVFFDVAKDPAKPFIVYTPDGLKTTVRGTSFDVRCYRALSRQEVSVKTGYVTVEEPTAQKALQLRPNDQATFNTASADFTYSKTDADKVGSWRDGRVYLDKVTWDEYAYQVKLYYGYTIETSHRELFKITDLVTTFNLRKPVEKAVLGVADLYGFKYRIDEDNKTIIIQ